MTWRFWTWFRAKPKPKPKSRVSLQLIGAPTIGWDISGDQIRFFVSGAGTVTGACIAIDGIPIHTMRLKKLRKTHVIDTDILVFDLVEFVTQNIKVVSSEDQHSDAAANAVAETAGGRIPSEPDHQQVHQG